MIMGYFSLAVSAVNDIEGKLVCLTKYPVLFCGLCKDSETYLKSSIFALFLFR